MLYFFYVLFNQGDPHKQSPLKLESFPKFYLYNYKIARTLINNIFGFRNLKKLSLYYKKSLIY